MTKERQKNELVEAQIDEGSISYRMGYASTPLVFFSSAGSLKKKNPRQTTKTISRTVLRHRDRPLRSFHLECQPEMCMAREPGPPITFRNRPRTHKALRAFVDRLFLDSFPRTYLPESCSNTFCRLLHLFQFHFPFWKSFVSSDLEENVWWDEKLCRDAT